MLRPFRLNKTLVSWVVLANSTCCRRFDLRVFLGPPDFAAREILLRRILKEVRHNLSDIEIRYIAKVSQQYSASDLGVVVRNAAWLPLGTIEPTRIPQLKAAEVNSHLTKNVFHIFGLAVQFRAAAFSKAKWAGRSS